MTGDCDNLPALVHFRYVHMFVIAACRGKPYVGRVQIVGVGLPSATVDHIRTHVGVQEVVVIPIAHWLPKCLSVAFGSIVVCFNFHRPVSHFGVVLGSVIASC